MSYTVRLYPTREAEYVGESPTVQYAYSQADIGDIVYKWISQYPEGVARVTLDHT